MKKYYRDSFAIIDRVILIIYLTIVRFRLFREGELFRKNFVIKGTEFCRKAHAQKI